MNPPSTEKPENSEIIEEFELNGKPAKVIRVQPEELNNPEFAQHAKNLADSNFIQLDIPDAQSKANLRTQIFKTRQKLGGIPIIGDKINNSKFLDDLQDQLYPNLTHPEHLYAYKTYTFPRHANKGQMIGVETEGEIAAIQSFKQVGEIPDQRPVYEMTKASTLKDPKYKSRGLNLKLKKIVYDQVMEQESNAVWIAASANKRHFEKLGKRGWHVVEMDDPHPAIRLMYDKDPEYCKKMKKQGYKALYIDPQVDQPIWGKLETPKT